jgi:hypothetical protein
LNMLASKTGCHYHIYPSLQKMLNWANICVIQHLKPWYQSHISGVQSMMWKVDLRHGVSSKPKLNRNPVKHNRRKCIIQTDTFNRSQGQ